MKSTEYKATDDSDIRDIQERNEDIDEEDDEIDGVNFSLLKYLIFNVIILIYMLNITM
jgi:hypothetical protein